MPAKNFSVADPDYILRIQDSFNRQGFMCDDLLQQHGFFHGGVVGALCDNAGAYAAFTLIEAEQSMLTVEYQGQSRGPRERSQTQSSRRSGALWPNANHLPGPCNCRY